MIHFIDSASAPIPNAISLDRVADYDPWFILLSYMLAVFGSFMAIAVLKAMRGTQGNMRRVGVVVGGIVLATAIWSMHYTGMLSYDMPMKHEYNTWLTAFSGLVALIFATGVFDILTRPDFSYRHIFYSAPLLGLGVASMHYTGMEAMVMDARLFYKPDLFALSIVIAVVASGAALWIMHTVRLLERYQSLAQVAASLVLGIAVCGLHYTGMMATVFVPYGNCRYDYNQSFLPLALAVGGMACLIIGMATSFLLYVRQLQARRVADTDLTFLTKLQSAVIVLTFLIIATTGLVAFHIQSVLQQTKLVNATGVGADILFDLRIMLFMVLPGITAVIVGIAALLQGRKLLARALHERVAKETAERANFAKSDFLANMSHELRTPLNSIMGMAQLLLATGTNAKQSDMLRTMNDASKSLLEIVEDILDFSKIETGNLELENISFSALECSAHVINMLAPIASKKGLTLAFHPQQDAGRLLMGDPVRYTRVLTNIVGNAVKYTERGTVDVHLALTDLTDGRIEVRAEIIDSGIGIAKDKLDKVFEKFTQADSSTTRKYGGSGLGLAITKQLVEMMHGAIAVESTLGIGSKFSFTIPFTAANQEGRDEEKEAQVANYSGVLLPAQVRVLIAEDHELNRVFVRQLMQFFGIAQYRIVGDGVAAMAEVATGRYDSVLMDCHMPIMNGYDATVAIREVEKVTGGHIPIIAMTANAMLGERERCLQLGMDEYISKPIDPMKLREVLSRWIRFPTESETPKPLRTTSQKTPRLDLASIRTFSEGNVEMEKEFAQLFVQQSNIHLAKLSQYCVSGTSIEWREAAHLLKGGAATLGAMKMRTICADAQEMLEATAAERSVMIENINREFMHVCDALKRMQLL